MTRDEFNRSMERVLVFYQRPRTPDQVQDFQGYMNVLFDDLRSITGELFEETTKELVRCLPRGQKPQPPQFWAIYHKIAEAKALSTEQGPPKDHHGLARMTADAEKMGQQGAVFALQQADVRGIRLPPEIEEILLRKACAVEEPEEKPASPASPS